MDALSSLQLGGKLACTPGLRAARSSAIQRSLSTLGGVALSFSVAALVQAAPAPALTSCLDAPANQRAVQRLNRVRLGDDAAPCGPRVPQTAPLSGDIRLDAASQQQARDLALRDTLSHQDAQGQTLVPRLARSGYVAQLAGETLAAGAASFDEALSLWLASPPHCKTLMTADYVDVGIACVQRPGSRLERFWVAQFAAPKP
jgi:uncharacterized protein YkwD